MAQSTIVPLPKGTWVLVTNSDITSLTFQNRGGGLLLVKATVGAVAPTDLSGALAYPTQRGELNIPLLDLFPGVAGANRVYAYSGNLTGQIAVSHA